MVNATLASWSPNTDCASANQSARNSITANTAANPGVPRLNVNPRVDLAWQIPPWSTTNYAASPAAAARRMSALAVSGQLPSSPLWLMLFGHHHVAQSTGPGEHCAHRRLGRTLFPDARHPSSGPFPRQFMQVKGALIPKRVKIVLSA